MHTLDARLPHRISVFEATNNVIANLDRKPETVMASFLECEPQPFRVPGVRNRKHDVRPPLGRDSQA